MQIRPKWLPVVVLVIAAGVGIALILRHQLLADPILATGHLIEPRSRVADFSLIDHQGRPFTAANLAGHWSMLYFGYTNCPDVCPATLSILAAMEKRLRAARSATRPQVLFVTADPARDTPTQLAAYVPYFDPEFIGLTARDQSTVEAFAGRLGVEVDLVHQPDGSYSVEHSTAILVVDPEGRLAAVLTGPFTAAALQADFRSIAGARS
jgi:protein SCO1/2